MEKRLGAYGKKFIVILIIFSMLLLNGGPILTNISFAAEDAESNVEVNGYFSGEGMENTNSLICDVNNQTIKINFDISVKGEGYLKNGAIKLGNDLNFIVNPDESTSIRDGQLRLPEVNNTANLNVSIPISFESKKNFKIEDLSKTNTIIFKGEYIDSENIIHPIEKEVNLDLTWTETTSSNVKYELIKNLDFEKDGVKGKILQTKINLSANTENNLPIKSTELVVDIPMAEGLELAETTVDVSKLSFTQGKEDYNTDFTKANYRVENGKVIISVNNNEVDGLVNKTIGEDSYILTFIYNGEINTSVNAVSVATVKINNFGGNEETVTGEMSCDLYESIGETVQYFKENKETPISKGYLVANSNQEKYEITYVEKDILNVNRADLVTGLEIVDVDEYFTNENETTKYDLNESIAYKKTEFSRENLLNILGENGKVEILNMSDEVIGTVTLDMETEDGMYVVEYGDLISAIKLRFSAPISDGNITVVSTKSIKKLDYSRETIRNFSKLISHSQGYATYEGDIKTDLELVETSIGVSTTQSSATLEMIPTELSTTSLNEDVTFMIKLNNNSDESDLYENPVFEVKLPQAIRGVNVKNIDLFYANGELAVAGVETFLGGDNQIIRVALSGLQSSYNVNKETNGTVISLSADITLDEMTGNMTEAIEMNYYNEGSAQYTNEKDWSMFIDNSDIAYLKNGYDAINVSYKGPEGLVNGQTTETKEEQEEQPVENNEENEENNEEDQNNNNKVVSLNQGAESDLLEEGVEAKLATMYISVLNNTARNYNNFKILGRIPFIGNKEITTGKDLGTTVDTILDTVITSSYSDVPYTVYYSENGEATDDLYDENNGWVTDFYKGGAVKSYLIVLNEEYVLERNGKLEFTYDYVIPANLQAGDAFYGTYATYFTETSTQLSTKSSADKIGYEIESKTDIQATINLVKDIKELSETEYEILLTNNSDVDAKNVVVNLEVPMEFMANNSNSLSISKTDTTKTVTLEEVDVPAHSEKIIKASFYVRKFNAEEVSVKVLGNVEGKNLNTSVAIESVENPVEKTKIEVTDNYYSSLMVAGSEYKNDFYIRNVSNEDYHNLTITKKLDDSFEFRASEIRGTVYNAEAREAIYAEYMTNEDGSTNPEVMEEMYNKIDAIEKKDLQVSETYDRNTNTITWTIEEFKYGDTLKVDYSLFIKTKAGAEGINIKPIETTYDLNDGKTVLTSKNDIKFNQSDVNVQMINANEIGYGNQGEEVVYMWEITNNNPYAITDCAITPNISEDADITLLRLERPNIQKDYHADSTRHVLTTLEPNETARFIMKTKIKKYITSEQVNASIDVKYDDTYKDKLEAVTVLENKINTGNQMCGTAYIDNNSNQMFDDGDTVLSGVIANLYNSETNELVASQITDIQGRYEFKNLDNSIYYVKFNYDSTQYAISAEKNLTTNNASILNLNNGTVTDNITIAEKSVSGVDVPLQNDNIFDMKLDAQVEKITVQNSAEKSEYVPENKDLGKVDIDPDLVSDTKVFIEYKVIVKNQGTIPGKVTKIVDYTTDGIEFDSTLNSDWYVEADGNIATISLKNDEIQPGESRELKLVLAKKLTEDSTGIVYNSFEIAGATNDKGMTDIDSVPGNKLNEDDLAMANTIIGVKTGMTARKATTVALYIVLAILVIILLYRYIDRRRLV